MCLEGKKRRKMGRGRKIDGSVEEEGWIRGVKRERREREMAKLPSLEVGLADTMAGPWVRG